MNFKCYYGYNDKVHCSCGDMVEVTLGCKPISL